MNRGHVLLAENIYNHFIVLLHICYMYVYIRKSLALLYYKLKFYIVTQFSHYK